MRINVDPQQMSILPNRRWPYAVYPPISIIYKSSIHQSLLDKTTQSGWKKEKIVFGLEIET